jgi:hydrogenase nickel incorporation protein HypA/HybF
MHEWTMASRLISALQDHVKSEGGGKVISATVRVGTLSMVDPTTMKEALETLAEPAGMEGAKFEVERVDTQFSCRKCGRKWAFSEVGDDVKKEVPPELTHEEEDEKGSHAHYPLELLYAYMACPKCGGKDYDTTDLSGAILEKVVLEK